MSNEEKISSDGLFSSLSPSHVPSLSSSSNLISINHFCTSPRNHSQRTNKDEGDVVYSTLLYMISLNPQMLTSPLTPPIILTPQIVPFKDIRIATKGWDERLHDVGY